MKRQLYIDRILVFNDFPELFLAKDSLGVSYLCLLTNLHPDNFSYVCVSVSNKVLYQFLNGKKDLREIFAEPELKEWWTTKDTSEASITISYYDVTTLEEVFLPDEGFFFDNETQDDLIRQEVIEHNNVIIHLSLSDEKDNQSIPIEDLGDFTKLYQIIVENSYKKAIQHSDLKEKKSFIIPNNYSLRAFAASPGSFNLHLKSNSNKDLFGNSIIEEGLKLIDSIIIPADNEALLIQNLRRIKGHAISNYKRLLEKIINKNVSFRYKWISPASNEIQSRTITTDYAIKIKDILALKEELAEEIKTFVGVVMQADVEKGGWRIINEEDGKDYTGESDGHLLQGITLETVRYRFKCQEIIESLKVTEQEKIKYILLSIDQED